MNGCVFNNTLDRELLFPRSLAALGCMPYGTKHDLISADPIQNDVRRATDYELAYAWLDSSAAQMGMMFQSFDHGNDPYG